MAENPVTQRPATAPETTVSCPVARGPEGGRTPAPLEPAGSTVDNLDPCLEHAWHPVALSRGLRPGGWLQVRLLGRNWTLRLDGHTVSADPPAFGVRERLGLVWLAPAEPADVPLEVPEAADRRFVVGRPVPVRSAGSAGPLAGTLLDATQGSVVHGATIDARAGAGIRPPEVTAEPGGFSSIQEQWSDDRTDPEVATGGRPLRRRTTCTYRAPFQLGLRQEFLDSGPTATMLYLLQPEDLDSTRIHAVLLLASGPGAPLPAPTEVAGQVARQHRILEEAVRFPAARELPLERRDDLHVATDRLHEALRQALLDFAVASRRRQEAA
jgi:hypothetical protein